MAVGTYLIESPVQIYGTVLCPYSMKNISLVLYAPNVCPYPNSPWAMCTPNEITA